VRRRDDGPERPPAGAPVRRGGRGDRRRADEARRLGERAALRVAIAIAHEARAPVKLVGVGETLRRTYGPIVRARNYARALVGADGA
jgi:hypothetical protein